ncbi:MAG: hypothetical protein V7647_2933 [Acidobacteriota bacterium]|jgi:hypothetical protein
MDRRFGWVGAIAGMFAVAIVGMVAYNAGVAHGLAMSAGGRVPPGWYRPWDAGFGPLFLLLFWLLALRFLIGGRHYGRRWFGGDHYGPPPAFEEWHRRAHERMRDQPAVPGA